MFEQKLPRSGRFSQKEQTKWCEVGLQAHNQQSAGRVGPRKLLCSPSKKGRFSVCAAAAQAVDTEKTFTRLQNGSDIRGIAIEGLSTWLLAS